MSLAFGDIVLVPFPFTDQSGAKKRPAVIVSSAKYNAARRDVILMAVTSQVSKISAFGETPVTDWRQAGLLFSSTIKPVVATIEATLVLRSLGALSPRDQSTLKSNISEILC